MISKRWDMWYWIGAGVFTKLGWFTEKNKMKFGLNKSRWFNIQSQYHKHGMNNIDTLLAISLFLNFISIFPCHKYCHVPITLVYQHS